LAVYKKEKMLLLILSAYKKAGVFLGSMAATFTGLTFFPSWVKWLSFSWSCGNDKKPFCRTLENWKIIRSIAIKHKTE